MKPLTLGDLHCAARRVHTYLRSDRQAEAERLVHEAECADQHCRQTGRAHPAWGNGTLMARASEAPVPPAPSLDDPDFLETIATVALVLGAARRRDSASQVLPIEIRA